MPSQPREFSDEERRSLKSLADLVNARLAELSSRSEQIRPSLVGQAAVPALAELREALTPIQVGAVAGLMTTAALVSSLRLMEHTASGGYTPPEHLRRTLKAAQDALDNCENSFYNIKANAGDAEDARLALEHVLTQSPSTRLSEVAISGRELARQNVKPIGGAFLSDLPYNPVVATPRPLGVALVATCLSIIAARMANLDLTGGIWMEVQDLGPQAEIAFKGHELPDEALDEIAAELSLHTGQTPSIEVQATDGALRLVFAGGQKRSWGPGSRRVYQRRRVIQTDH